ncbi:MAG: ASKHA domain-containing protein [Dehalococcoidia bacterium]
MEEYKILFRPSGRKVTCSARSDILSCCRRNDIAINSVCGGQGKCRSCRVRIEKGSAGPPTAAERKKLSRQELESGWRLACQTRPARDLTVYLPPVRGLTSTPAFKEELLAGIVPDGRARRAGKAPGVAVDLGTTKIAGYLVDLRDGRILGSCAVANPQEVYGDDVISRITYAMGSDNGEKKLQKKAVAAIDELIKKLCLGADCEPGMISRVSVCGNTAMHHLLLGLPVGQLAHAPYLPWTKDPVSMRAGRLGLKSVEKADVYLLPIIGGYVGGDHVAVLAATDAADRKSPTLIVDIGTNTEISLAGAGGITSVSCASGPAFEGGHIKHGMKASARAIDRIVIKDGRVRYRTIGRHRPVGICGSGMLDAVAQMSIAGLLDPGGRIRRESPLIRLEGGQPEMSIAGGDRSAGGEDIVITQGDIRELQLAKAAIRTGIDILLETAGMAADDVKRVIIAGTFGNYIDIKSAVRVGMLPDLPLRRFSQVGNAAGAGACMVLVSQTARKKAEYMAGDVRYIELADRPDFMQVFVRALGIPS